MQFALPTTHSLFMIVDSRRLNLFLPGAAAASGDVALTANRYVDVDDEDDEDDDARRDIDGFDTIQASASRRQESARGRGGGR